MKSSQNLYDALKELLLMSNRDFGMTPFITKEEFLALKVRRQAAKASAEAAVKQWEDTADENDVYAAIIGETERLEHEGIYKGNGHHLAQRLTAMIMEKLKPEKVS